MVGCQTRNRTIKKQFIVDFPQNLVTSCIEFFNSGIYKNVPEDWWTPLDIDNGFGLIDVVGLRYKTIHGKEEYVISLGAKPVLTNGNIADACGTCADAEYCQIYWVVRGEVQ